MYEKVSEDWACHRHSYRDMDILYECVWMILWIMSLHVHLGRE